MIYVNAKTNDGLGFFLTVEPETLVIQGFRLLPEDQAGHTQYAPGEAFHPLLAGFKIAHIGEAKVFQLAALKASNQWFDHSNWFFGVNPDTLDVLEGRNLYADTAITHEGAKEYSISARQQRPAFFLTVPHVGATFADCGITVICDKRLPLITENETVAYNPDEHMHKTFPVIQIEGAGEVAHDGFVALTISAKTTEGGVYPHPLEVYLEVTAGYLPKQRIEVNGSATCKVYALGLDAGDSIKLKAGFRFYSGKAEALIKVT